MKEYLTTVELSTTKVSVAVGEKVSPDIIKVAAHCTTPLPKGIVRGEVVNAQKVIEALKDTIRKAEEEISAPIKKIVLCMSSQSLRCEELSIKQERIAAGSFIGTEEIAQLTQKAEQHEVPSNEKIFAAIPQSYNVDDAIGISPTDIAGMHGNTIEAFFKLIIGKKSSYDYKMEIAEKCNLKVIHTVLSPIGSAVATCGDNEAENGVAVLDIGAGSTDIIIVKDKIIRYVGVIPFGGKSITDDIKSVTNVTSQHAEYIKTRYGRALEDGTPENKKLTIQGTGGSPETNIQLTKLSAIIEARLAEIFEAASYHIEQSGFHNNIASIIITGGTSYMDEIKVLSKAVTGFDTRLANAQGKITDNSPDSCFDTYSSSIIGCLYDSLKKEIDKIAARPDNCTLFEDEDINKQPADNKDGTSKKGKKERKTDSDTKKTNWNSLFDKFFDNNNKA